jgi:hypothetical protein
MVEVWEFTLVDSVDSEYRLASDEWAEQITFPLEEAEID